MLDNNQKVKQMRRQRTFLEAHLESVPSSLLHSAQTHIQQSHHTVSVSGSVSISISVQPEVRMPLPCTSLMPKSWRIVRINLVSLSYSITGLTNNPCADSMIWHGPDIQLLLFNSKVSGQKT